MSLSGFENMKMIQSDPGGLGKVSSADAAFAGGIWGWVCLHPFP